MSSSAQHGLGEFMCLLDSIEHGDSDRGPSFLIEKVKEIQAVYPEWDPLETVDDNVGATALHHLVGVRKGDAEDYEEEDGAGEMMMMSESDQQLLQIYHMFVMPKAASVPTLSKFLLEFPRDASGESLLHYAARGGRVGLVDALIKDATAALTASSANGAGDEQTAESLARKLITAPDEDSGATPFHFAAKGGHVGVLQLFMKYDAYCAPLANEKFLARARVAAKVMEEESSSSRVAEESFPTPLFLVKDKEGMSSAQYAAGSGNVATMRFLADKGAKVLLERVSFAGSEDRTTHCECADVPESEEKKKSDEKENDIDQFIRESVDFLFLKDAEGTTTLHMAAFSGSIEMLEMIVSEASSLGAEGTTNTEQNVIAATCPLLTASSNGRVPEGGPLADARGQTPLHFATMAGASEEVIDYLLSLKAALPLHSPSSSSNVGSVATDATVTSSSPLAVAVVVFAINVSAATASDQMTALHYAAANGDEQIMERLLRGRAEEEEENTDEKKTKKEGGGDVGVINYYHRANPNLANSEGMTANDILAEGEEQQEQEGCCVNHPYHHDHDACCDGGNSHSH